MFYLFAASFVLFSVTCDAADAFPPWCVVPSTVHVLQNETCATYQSLASSKVVWYAMRGEEENKQVLLDLSGWPASLNLTATLSADMSDLQLVGGTAVLSGVLAWWQVGYVYCNPTTRYPGSGGGWRPDPVLAADNGAILLETGVTQPLWLDLKVPYGVPDGQYVGSVTLTVDFNNGSYLTQVIAIEATVWKIDLPRVQDAKFPAIFSFDSDNLNAVYPTVTDSLKKAFFDILTDQRMGGNNLYTTVPANISDSLYLAAGGNQWLTLFNVNRALGMGSRRPAPYSGAVGTPKDSCLNFTDALVVEVLTILAPVVQEYEARNILENVFVYGFDEVGPDCLQSIRNVFGAIKEVWPQLRTVAVLNWEPPTDLPLDVWVLQYEEFDPAQAQPWIDAGKQQWWYHCIEPSGLGYLNTFIERPLMEARLLFWLASAHQISGWLFWSDVMWQRYPTANTPISRLEGTARTDFDPANYVWYPETDIFVNGDGNLLYPGSEGPVQSVRLHNIRDGFEDAELLKMVASSAAQSLVQPLVRSATDYTLDPLLLEQQRLQAAELVLKASTLNIPQ